MEALRDILAGLSPQQDSDKPEMTADDDFSDLDSYDARITSAKAEARGIEAHCGPAPEPVICEYCGASLYFEGIVMPGITDRSGNKHPPHIFRWSEQPERCSCPEATRHWAEHDAEVERKKREEDAARERKRHKEKVDALLSKSGIRKRFQQRTFDRFVQDTPGQKKAYRIAREYAENFEAELAAGEGLYIEGTNGSGKTHLAAAIGLYLTEKEYSVVMKTSFDLLDDVKKAFDNPEISEHKIMQGYKECDLLIIDDLGKEQCTDWSMSVLYAIVNERYEAMRPIIITTNFGSDDLIRTLTPKGYGSQKIEAIISRLREVSKTLTMAWEDYRGR